MLSAMEKEMNIEGPNDGILKFWATGSASRSDTATVEACVRACVIIPMFLLLWLLFYGVCARDAGAKSKA